MSGSSRWMAKAADSLSQVKSTVQSLHVGESLRARALRGGAWLGSASVAEQSARMIRNLILVRLLVPASFGTMAIVLSITSVLQAFTEVGVWSALIQNPRGKEPQYVNAAWWMAFSRSLLIGSCMFFGAPWIGKFYGNTELSGFLRLVVIGQLLEGAMSPMAYIAMKEMKYSRWAKITNGGAILGIVTTVTLGFILHSTWALVIGTVSESAFRCLLSYIVCPHLPSLALDRDAFRDLFKFTKGMFGLSALNLIFNRADVFVLAKLLPATQLGFYTMAVSLAQVPAGFVANVIAQIMMPAASHVQDDRPRINRLVFQVTAVIALLGLPAVAFAFFCARPLLTILYGHGYAVASSCLFLASCIAVMNLFNNQITSSFFALGTPQLHRRAVAAMAVTMVILTYPMCKWLGLVGGQVAGLIAVTIGYALQLESMTHVTALKFSAYGKVFVQALGVSAAVVIVCLTSRLFTTLDSPITIIGWGLAGCLLAYGLAGIVFFQNSKLANSVAN